MALSDARAFLSVPCPVHWAGWESNTARLYSRGWALTVEKGRLYDNELSIMMRHEQSGIMLLAIARDVVSHRVIFDRKPPTFEVIQMAGHMHMIVNHTGPLEFGDMWYQADGRMSMSHEFDLDKVPGLFAPIKPRVQEILIEPESVEECFNLIKKLQAPDLARIRESNRKREPFLQAQILSLA